MYTGSLEEKSNEDLKTLLFLYFCLLFSKRVFSHPLFFSKNFNAFPNTFLPMPACALCPFSCFFFFVKKILKCFLSFFSGPAHAPPLPRAPQPPAGSPRPPAPVGVLHILGLLVLQRIRRGRRRRGRRRRGGEAGCQEAPPDEIGLQVCRHSNSYGELTCFFFTFFWTKKIEGKIIDVGSGSGNDETTKYLTPLCPMTTVIFQEKYHETPKKALFDTFFYFLLSRPYHHHSTSSDEDPYSVAGSGGSGNGGGGRSRYDGRINVHVVVFKFIFEKT